MLHIPEIDLLILEDLEIQDVTSLACVSKSYQVSVSTSDIWNSLLKRDYSARYTSCDQSTPKRTYLNIKKASLETILSRDRLDLLMIKHPTFLTKTRYLSWEFKYLCETTSSFVLERLFLIYPKRVFEYFGPFLRTRFLRGYYDEGLEKFDRMGRTVAGRYHRAREVNKAFYKNDLIEARRLLDEGACPDPPLYNYLLLEDNKEGLALLEGKSVHPTKKGIGKAIQKKGIETAVSLILYDKTPRILRMTLFQSAKHSPSTFDYLLANVGYSEQTVALARRERRLRERRQ